MTPSDLDHYEREARADDIRSMALFAMCFAALSGFIVGYLVGALT